MMPPPIFRQFAKLLLTNDLTYAVLCDCPSENQPSSHLRFCEHIDL